MSWTRRKTWFAKGIIYAIIASGGFGIFRYLMGAHDAIAFGAIALAIALVWLLRLIAQSAHSSSAQHREAVSLNRIAASSFEFYPGGPAGYAAYTDHNAMGAVLNDDLVARTAPDQFIIVGFAHGFLVTLFERWTLHERTERMRFELVDPTERDRRLTGWLGWVQEQGIDNAGPSTANLFAVLVGLSVELRKSGPIRFGYWEQPDGKDAERLTVTPVISGEMDVFMNDFEQAFAAGRHVAEQAVAR